MFIEKRNRVEIAKWLSEGMEKGECLLISSYKNGEYQTEHLLVSDAHGLNVARIDFGDDFTEDDQGHHNWDRGATRVKMIKDLSFLEGLDYDYKIFSIPINGVSLTLYPNEEVLRGLDRLKKSQNSALIFRDTAFELDHDNNLLYFGGTAPNKISESISFVYNLGYLILKLDNQEFMTLNKKINKK